MAAIAQKRVRIDGQLTQEQYFAVPPSTTPRGFELAPTPTLAARRIVRARRAETVLNEAMFGASVGALNASFAAWVEAQVAARPDVPVVEAALDYLSYARAAEISGALQGGANAGAAASEQPAGAPTPPLSPPPSSLTPSGASLRL